MKSTIKRFLFGAAFTVASIAAMGQTQPVNPGLNAIDGCPLYAPTAFTPNGDNVNDYFTVRISELCNPVDYHLRVFDRWGRLVFESGDPNKEWDGTFDGSYIKEGVYIWRLVAHYETSSADRVVTLDQNGSVMVIR